MVFLVEEGEEVVRGILASICYITIYQNTVSKNL